MIAGSDDLERIFALCCLAAVACLRCRVRRFLFLVEAELSTFPVLLRFSNDDMLSYAPIDFLIVVER